jgi:hypothetical protein
MTCVFLRAGASPEYNKFDDPIDSCASFIRDEEPIMIPSFEDKKTKLGYAGMHDFSATFNKML